MADMVYRGRTAHWTTMPPAQGIDMLRAPSHRFAHDRDGTAVDEDRSDLRRYGMAVAVTVLALVAALAVDSWSAAASPFPLFLAAVMVSSWYGGFGPGLCSVAVGGLAISYFFIPPFRALGVATLTGALQLAVTVLVALLISSLNVRRRQAEEQARSRAIRLRVLTDMAYELAETNLELPAILNAAAARTTDAIGDGCIIRLVAADEQMLEAVAVAHADPATTADLRRFLAASPKATDEELLARAVRSGRPLDGPTRPTPDGGAPVERGDRPGSVRPETGYLLVAPLPAQGRALGTLTVWRDRSGSRYTSEEQAFLRDLGVCAALAIDNARLYGQAREAETRYRALFEGAADPILVTGADRSVLDANPAATELLGYERADLLRRRGNELALGQWPMPDAIEPNQIRGGGHWRGEFEARRKEGSPVSVEASLTRLELASGPVYLTMLRDISERRRLEQLQRDFLSTVSHDLRTPLTAIRTGVVLLEASAADRLRPDERQLLGHARTNSERLGLLISDLLAVNQIEAGTLQLEREPLDLRATVSTAVAAVHAPIQEKGQTLEVDLPEALPVDGDRRRLEQVVVNLLANAHRHTPPGARIVASGRAGAGEVRLTVQDDGPGIPATEVESIFRRFYRLAAGGDGSGLGLPIARGLVELHGGRIWAERDPAGGSAFHVVLPRDHDGGGS
jgi:PAS domain S-box-containing protein